MSSSKLQSNERRKLKRSLIEYYDSYYNHHFLRDFRYIYDDKTIHKYNDVLNAKKYNELDNSKKKALHFLTSSNHLGRSGLLGGELSYFKNLNEYLQGNHQDRFHDRFFFDLDIEDARVDHIKSEMKDAISNLKGTSKSKKINELKSNFRKLILEDDLLLPIFKESQSLMNYLEGYDLKPYLVFSGSKGFHVNVFFSEMKLKNIHEISNSLANSFAKTLNLNYLDFSVNKDAHRRLQRVQYAIHSKTDLITLPLYENITYDETLKLIKKNKRVPIDFDYDSYLAPKEFNQMLSHLDEQIGIKLAREQKRKDDLVKQRRNFKKKKYKGKLKSFKDIDMRELIQAIGIPISEDKGHKLIISCPFHDDKNPSSVVFEHRFHCSSCNLTLNYYDFISKYYGIQDKKAIMKQLNDLIS